MSFSISLHGVASRDGDDFWGSTPLEKKRSWHSDRTNSAPSVLAAGNVPKPPTYSMEIRVARTAPAFISLVESS
eukprot:704475-Pleurochrysis_carterae.AAC.1